MFSKVFWHNSNEMSQFTNRLNSFYTLNDSGIKVPKYHFPIDIKSIAREGLYFIGTDFNGLDKVCCFSCGICLHGFKETDIASTEHIRHSPTCSFMQAIYGDEYINYVIMINSLCTKQQAKEAPKYSAMLKNELETKCEQLWMDKMCLICCEKERRHIFLHCNHFVRFL